MIQEDYCSYEVSKLLKEKGFDEPCLQMWECGPDTKYLFRLQSSCYQNITEEDSCLAPTYQMAIKWLREKSIECVIIPIWNTIGKQYRSYVLSDLDNKYKDNCDSYSDHISYEEAVEASIKYALENLI